MTLPKLVWIHLPFPYVLILLFNYCAVSGVASWISPSHSVHNTDLPPAPGFWSPQRQHSRLKVTTSTHQTHSQSYITSIRTENFAGLSGTNQERSDIVIAFDNPHLAVVTGETGSGKSLLIARALEFITGTGKLSASLLLGSKEQRRERQQQQQQQQQQGNPETTEKSHIAVEVSIVLMGPYLAKVPQILRELSLDPIVVRLNPDDNHQSVLVRLKRTLSLESAKDDSHSLPRRRAKSSCYINDHIVTLKTLTAFSAPLLTVLDAAAAAAALSKAETRLAIIDSAITKDMIQQTRLAEKHYRQMKRLRENYERQVADLPHGGEARDDIALLNHWIDELDSFRDRVKVLCQAMQTNRDGTTTRAVPSWTIDTYSILRDFRDDFLELQEQYRATQSALECLSSLASTQSAATALEKARSFLTQASSLSSSASECSTGGGRKNDDNHRIHQAAERSHELLNAVETALSKCTRFLEDDDGGLLRQIELSLEQSSVPLDRLDALLLDWSTLARKHGVAPANLPNCHYSLQQERDGTVQARLELPKARENENEAWTNYQLLARQLTTERRNVAQRVSASVSRRLPDLGMERSLFAAHIIPRNESGTNVVDDRAEFVLLQKQEDSNNDITGGRVHEVASAGEKARILLAIECALPGSVGASFVSKSQQDYAQWDLPPLAVVYDEIDAHVGGRAAVALSGMLVDQARWSQVISITHSPAVAAVADAHVVIQRVDNNGQAVVHANSLDGAARRRELARMASGDMASVEAENFAEALIRDLTKAKQLKS